MEQSNSETVPLSPSYRETVYEHERLYQKQSYDNRIYCVPIDEEEEARLEIQHEVMSRLFRHNLFLGYKEYPDAVLECGYGQAQWVIAVAQQYEDCQVTGIDIYPLDLPDEPDNLQRICDDLNQELAYDAESFDVIQSRFVAQGIHKNRWRSYIQELFKLLRPAGSLQMIEYYFNIQSASGSLQADSALYEWGHKLREALSRDRDLRIASSDPRAGGLTRLQALMEEAGFVDIEHQHENVPIGDWSTDPRSKTIGKRNLDNMDKAFDSFGTWPFIERLGMTLEEVKRLNDRARAELRDSRIKAYIPVTAVWGFRPQTDTLGNENPSRD